MKDKDLLTLAMQMAAVIKEATHLFPLAVSARERYVRDQLVESMLNGFGRQGAMRILEQVLRIPSIE